MGVTEQLIGPAWNAPKAYQYAGSVGPVVLTAAAETCLRRLGAAISERFGLRGLFGIDFILAEDDSVWPVEVNPRYTASIEVLENAMQISLLSHHLEAYLHEHLPAFETGRPAIISGKLFLYARRTLVVGEATIKRIADHGDVVIADIPRLGSRLAVGDPICTVLLTAATVEEARRRLAESIAFAG
jgi:predicted ATP-grasp superfamily ATP-dependent carboligase